MKIYHKAKKLAINITIGSAKRLKERTDVDLVNIFTSEDLSKIKNDPYLLAEVLYQLTVDDTGKMIDEAEFYECLTGEVLLEAVDVFQEELVNFFPPAKRTAITATLRKLEEVEKAACELGVKQIEKLNAQEVARKAITGALSTSVPE